MIFCMIRQMYYVLQDNTLRNPTMTRRLMLGENEVVVTKNALYGQKNVYILPKNNGTYIIGGIEFFRGDRGVLVQQAEAY